MMHTASAFFVLPPLVHDGPRNAIQIGELGKEFAQWADQNAEMLRTLGLDGTVRDIKNAINIKTGDPKAAVERIIQLEPALRMLKELPEIEEIGVLEDNAKGIMAITRETLSFAPLPATIDGTPIKRNEANYRSHAITNRRYDQYELERNSLSQFGEDDEESGFIIDQTNRIQTSLQNAASSSTKTELIAAEIELTAIEAETMIADLRRKIRLGDLQVGHLHNQDDVRKKNQYYKDLGKAEATGKFDETGTASIEEVTIATDAQEYTAPSASGDGYRDPKSGLALSEEGVTLIINHEVGGESYYNSRLKKPTYPGGASGVTVGIGYDLGYNSKAQIAADWGGHVSASVLSRFQGVAGLKRGAAQARISGMRDIQVPFEAAKAVFYKKTMPRFCRLTNGAFPTTENLHGHSQSALVSLVFNRGSALKGARRREMREIRTHILNKNLTAVPGRFRAMKRIWQGTGLNGLLRRRDEEAALFQRGL